MALLLALTMQRARNREAPLVEHSASSRLVRQLTAEHCGSGTCKRGNSCEMANRCCASWPSRPHNVARMTNLSDSIPMILVCLPISVILYLFAGAASACASSGRSTRLKGWDHASEIVAVLKLKHAHVRTKATTQPHTGPTRSPLPRKSKASAIRVVTETLHHPQVNTPPYSEPL